MDLPERRLPDEVLGRATRRDNEYAWPIDAIPDVIDAARIAGLVSIGGQLQLRFPDGSICEAYWIEVDTFRNAPSLHVWKERVVWSAREALAQFESLQSRYDLEEEGMKACPEYTAKFSSIGIDPSEALCFVWYIEAEPV